MFMQMSGLMGRVMDVEFILVRMEVDYVGKFKWGSSMALAITILGNFSSPVDLVLLINWGVSC